MNIERTFHWIILALIAVTSGVAPAESSITVDGVAQRWPWNNKLDITYTVSGGQNVEAGVFAKVEFTATIDGITYDIDGSCIGANASDGTHVATWTVPAGLRAKGCTMSAALRSSNAPSGNDYMVIDLDTGDVTYEGLLATQKASDTRYLNDIYKTDKLLLRKVAGGGREYKVGDWRDETHKSRMWSVSRDFYIGVYPVTQYQYQKLCDSNPSYFQKQISGNEIHLRPVETVSWDDLRVKGTAPASPIPASDSADSGTFFQRLNHKTGLYFDLPTEVMFEISERAKDGNVSSTYFWGSDKSLGVNYCVCSENSSDSTVAVGSHSPNDWGIYDTAGNVWEWCLDDDSLVKLWEGIDALVPACASGANRRLRGGGTYNQSVVSQELNFRTSTRYQAAPEKQSFVFGFRVSHVTK